MRFPYQIFVRILCFLKFFPFYFLKAIDEPRAGLSESFFVGQSVRANIVDVCELWTQGPTFILFKI